MGLVYNTKNGTYEYELANKILQKPTDIPKKKSKKNNAKVPSSKKQENINYFDDGYDFGDVTRTGIQLGKNLVKTPENFKDGYQFGDITKTIGASALDLGAGTVKAIMNHGESGIADPLQYGVAQVSDWMGFDKFANAVRENAKQNGVEQTFAPIDKLTDKYTAIGTTGDQLSSSIGNVIAMANASALLKAKGLPSSVNVGKFAMPITSIASGIGSGMTEAYNNGASDGEAWTYGALSGLAEGFSESLFGGLGKKFNLNVGEGGLDDFLIKRFTDKISNKTLRILAESGLKATGEGVEEILSGIGSAVSKKLTYLSKEDLKTLIKDENLAEQFIMGTLTSLISQTPGTIQSVKTGTDLITGQPTNNQALTLENMQENVPYTVKNNKGNAIAPLGNNVLNNTVLNENNQPYNVLNDGKEYAPYVPINNTFRYKKSTNPKINALNESMVKNNFDNSIESKSLSEVASVIIKDKGWNVLFDNTITNKKGESVNALVTTENGEITIRVNPNSTRAAEFLIIHEVTHGIETSELLKLANDYASKNPEFAKVMESLKTKYSEKDINSEVLADISGQLFGNQDFINSLVQDGSIQNKNIITKIYDAIKRLLNSLTEKGRQKNAYYDFVSELEQKWREAYKQTTTERAINNLKRNTKYHLSENARKEILDAVYNKNTKINNMVQVRDFTPQILVNLGLNNYRMMVRKGHLRENILTKNEAKQLGYSITRKHYHGLGVNTYLKIIDSMDKPIAVYQHTGNGKYEKDNYVVLTNIKNDAGETIIIPIVINKKGQYNHLNFDINRIKTAYGVNPEHYFNNQVKKGFLIKVYDNKKSTKPSVQFGSLSAFSANNIPQSNNNVKSGISTKYSMQELENNYSNNNNLKQQQLDIILNNNPSEDNYHTWIRNIDDIKTFEESLQDNDYAGWEIDGFIPDYDANIVKQALKTGKITVYSSYPIEQGIFVTPSKMEAESYSGNGKIYSKEVNLKDVAWIDPTQGQYAKVDISNTKFSIDEIKDNQIQGLEDYTKPQIKNITTNYIKNALEYADVQADIVGMEIIGSRNRGTAKSNSDLDIVVELKGNNLREDDLFNLLNDTDEPLEINGIKVDINPIIAEKSGTLKEFMKRSNDYDKEQIKNSKSKYPDWINKIAPNEPYRKYKNYINDLMIQKQNETGLRIASDNSGVLVWQHGYASSLEKIKFEDTKKLAQQIYDLKATDNKGETLSNEIIQKTKNSKARDEKGKLLSLYHGSPNVDITEFDINKSGQNTMSAEYGIYFTDSKKSADDFSYERIETDSMFFDKKGKKGKVYEAYLNLEKPLDFRKLSKQEISDLYEYASHLGQLDGKETFIENMTKWQQIGNHQLMKGNLDLKKLSNKYDGFIAKMDVKNNELEYVVFNPKQVFFADKNNESIKTNNIDNKGYHLGDLGKGRDTYHWNMTSSRRSTGHFGTGTYFFGDLGLEITSMKKENRPIHEVDFSKYNLFKPKNENEAYTLHEGLKALNYINNFNSDDFESLQLMLEKHGISGQKSYEAFVKARELYFSDEYQNASYDSKLDSISTYFMKELGFNGIDVRGIEGFDNGTYGSVIYDLDKKNTNITDNNESVKTSNVDNKGRNLTKEQQEYFKDSKVRDENGNLIEVYHRTYKGGFTKFNSKVNFFTNDPNADFYGDDKYNVYLNIKNPLIIEGNGKNYNSLEFNEDGVKQYKTTTIENAINNMDKITKSDVVAIAKAIDSNNSLEDYIDEFNSPKEALDSVVDAYTEGGTLEDFVKQYGSLNIYIDNGNIKTKNVTTTRDITEYAKKKGYDGVIFKNIQDKTNGVADVYATLESPNQIKNVDNTNPTDNPDIRYSQENKTWKEHLEENYEATGTRTYMPDHTTDDYELWQDELNEILEKAKSVDEKLYNDIKQQNEEYRDRHRLEYRIYEETRSRQVGSEVNNDFFKEHFSDYDEQSGTKQADGIMTSIKLKKGNNLAKLSFTEGKDVIWIDELYVKNKNQGYGTEIVEAIKKYANENGKYVETHIELSTAEGFWDKTLRSNKNKNDDTKYSLNKDNKGRTLTKEQQNYFKNVSNELKDEKGNLKTLYHGSRNDFTIFDLEKSGESNKNARVGFWFTESKEGAENFANSIWYGENEKANAYEVYLNIKNPKVYEKNDYTERKEKLNSQLNKLNERKKVFDEKYHISSFITSYEGEDFLRVVGMMTSPYSTYTDEEYKQYIKGMVDKGTDVEQYFNEVKEYSKIKQETKKLEKELSGLRYNDPYEQFRTDIYKIVGKDAEDANIGGSGMALNDEKGTLEAFRNSLIEQGYDGIVIKNTVYDSKTMGGENNQYVAFYPNQIKNVDNLNPTDSDDIRYSMIEDPIEISKLKKEDANTTPKAPYVKLSDNTKRDGNSKHYSNLTEKSKFLNDKSVNAISNETGVKYYDTMTNQEVLKQAKKELDNGGSKETLKWFAKEPTHATPSDIAKGWILLKQYQDKGDYDSVVQVAKKMRLMGTTTGRTLQMYAIMERLTPQGMVKYAQAELSEAFEEMVKNKSKAWIDKYKSDFELTPSETKFIMDTMLEVSKMKDGYEKNVKLAEIQKLMTDKLPPEKGAGIKAWMRISMLFNPKTQVRNVLGNTVIAPVNAVSDVFASGIDKMVSKKTGVRTTGSINLKSYTSGFKQGLYESYNDFKKGINTRNVEGNRFEIGEGKSFNDKTLIGHKLNQVDNLLSFMLDAGDRGFYEAAFTNSINNQMILNNTKTVTPEMIDIATTEALQRTWQDNNEYTRFVLNTRKGLNKLMSIGNYGLGDILIPFAKTPANLTKAIVDYSPVGLVHSLVEGHNLKNAIETGQFTAQQQHKFVQDLGKAVAGTMLYVIGYALANAGAISGKNDEDKDTANFMKNTLGISPYSIKIGNKTFTYDWAQPVAAPFAIMSDFMSSNDEDASILEKSISAFNTGFNIVVEQSFMQSIKTVLDNNDGIATGIQEAIMELPSRAIPTLSKQIVDLTDGTQRQTFVYGKPLETAKNKVLAKIPGTSKALAPTVDTMGREIKKYGGKNNIFNVFFNPANVNNENISKSAGEIYRLYQETGRTDLMPRVSPYYINHKGEKIVLSNENKSRFQKISGDIIEQNVQKIMKSSQYQYLSDEEKADIIQDIVNYSYNKARFDVLGIEMSDTYQSVADYEDIGGNLSDYYLFQSSINNENSETKKQSISSFLIQSNLSDKEISYLYNKYYSSDKTMNMLSNFKIPIKEYIKLNLQSFESDYNQNGKAISGSKQAKIFNYINSLKLNATQKAILMKMQYKSFKKYDKQILNYINNMNATRFEKASFAKQIGFDYYDDYLINYILKQNTSNEEKINQLKNLGFRYINGKIYK